MILYLFAFISGLLTIFAPCIWPLLPIILAASATGGKQKPLGIVLGIIVSFGLLTLFLSSVIKILPFDTEILRFVAVGIIGLLGLSLVIPALSTFFETQVSKLVSKINPSTKKYFNSDFLNGLVTGLSLGIVWTPCAGPILGTIATLAATRAVSIEVFFVTFIYILGVGIPLFIFALSGQHIATYSKKFNSKTGSVQQAFGVIMIITALLIATGYDRTLQAKLLNLFPSYSTILYKLENAPQVKLELDRLKNRPTKSPNDLLDLGTAPEFSGIANWLNIDKPLTMRGLRGKVVLVDFWTYTCINCIRTLPYIKEWHKKYASKGLVIVGVHTPEFEFEKKTENVQNAILQYGLTYPVAQDNDFSTWNAFNNQYWPAKYLIDKEGVIRYTHFGEGNYEETEQIIRELLGEKILINQPSLLSVPLTIDTNLQLTPETYLGSLRADRYTDSATEIPLHYVRLTGEWNSQEEYIESKNNSLLGLHFSARDVYLVITPKSPLDTLSVFVDNKPVTLEDAGKDVQGGKVELSTSRLYHLVHFSKTKEAVLKLEFQQLGIKAFAFTFGK